MKTDSGFTLIELLVVLGVIALLILISIPAYSGVIEGARATAFDAQVRELKAAATMHIMAGGGDATWSARGGQEAQQIREDHEGWMKWLEKWPENPMRTGDFVVEIRGATITVTPGRGED